MSKKSIYLSLLFILVAALAALFVYSNLRSTLLPTYFSYSEKNYNSLRQLSTDQRMSKGNLKKWDFMMFELVKTHKLGDAYAAKIYAYVYTGQRDAAFLSYNVKQQFMGNLDSVTGGILCLFFVEDCPKIQFQIKKDSYSEQLAAIVLEKVKTRWAQDKPKETVLTLPEGKDFWMGVKPYYGQEVGGWKTWIISAPQDFLPPAPPKANSKEWQHQLQLTETALKNISPAQIKLVVFWAGNPSTVTPPGIWLKFANDYIEAQEISFAQIMLIRSVLAMGIADATIAVFYAKYTYWVKRPDMLNPSLQTVMPTPNHPSYPAAHSSISSAAAEILSHFFPENKQYWQAKANEASSSRVWGGIHFPLDTSIGMEQGKKIGKFAVQSQLTVD